YWTLEDEHESAKRFNDAYRAKYPDQGVPSAYGALGYAGVFGILNAVKEAGSTKADEVIAAMESMKYDPYKGEQYFRKCDHQAVQSVLILKAKAEADMRNEWDIFDIVGSQPADEEFLRTCEELGHKT